MAERTYFSKHISKADMAPSEVEAVQADTALFNQIKWSATRALSVQKNSLADNHIDLRLKENRDLRNGAPQSLHMQMKAEYGSDDHFTNSAINTAKGAVKSAKAQPVGCSLQTYKKTESQ